MTTYTAPLTSAQAAVLRGVLEDRGYDFEPNHADTGDSRAVLTWKYISQTPPNPTRDPRDQTRLMCSGEGLNPSKLGSQLIKKEWDWIETWPKKQEDDGKS